MKRRWLPRRREPETRPVKPNAYDLFVQADGDPDLYARLLADNDLPHAETVTGPP